MTVLEDVGYSDSGWIERELVRWFTAASCRVHLWEIGARLGGRYRRFTDKETAIINNVREFECRSENLEFDPPTPSRLHLDRQLARKQIAPNHRAVGINIKCFRHSGEGHAQRPSKRRSSERTIAAVGQTRSKWRAISSGKAARIKGTPEVDLELARRSSQQTGVPGREMEKILWIARETQ